MEFPAVLQLHGKTATGIAVPAQVVESLGTSKRPAVRVTINNYTYRTTVAARGDAFLVPVSAEHRTAAGISAGDKLDVDIQLDDQPREVVIPADLAKALKPDATAKHFFDGLSYSHRRSYVMWIEDAKKAETRERRVAKALEMLHVGKTR